MARTRSQKKTTDSDKHVNEKLELPTDRSVLSSTNSSVNRLPSEIFFLILQRLSVKNKFLFKTVCKKWRTFLISHILPKQHKLSIESVYFPPPRCIDPDHQFNVHDKNSIPLFPVSTIRNRKRFFEKEVTGVKVLKYCGGRDVYQFMKYCLSNGPSLSLQCLHVYSLEEPLVKVLPNLQHFSVENINLVSLVSVLQYCPVLTHLSINTRIYGYDVVDTLMNLPKGLQYLMLGGKSCELLAVICSPAMETLESVVLHSTNWAPREPFHKPDARVKPAPRLQRFALSSYMDREEDRRMIVDFLKECPALKKIDLRVTGLALGDYVDIYSRLSNLEMIKLGLVSEFDDVIHIILQRSRGSLKSLEIGDHLLNLESMKKLAEFPNLQTLFFSSTLPSDEQLMALAQGRLHVSQSRLQLKSKAWNENHLLDPFGTALQDANIELVDYGIYKEFPSVMD